MLALLLTAFYAPAPARADAFDRTWCAVEAGEFRLVTDHPREVAEDLAWRLQAFRPIAEQYLPGEPNADNPPLTILVFERSRDYRRAMNGSAMAGFMQPSFSESLMVVGPDPNAFSEHETLLHEYVHYLLRTRSGINIPAWFDEGIASMLSSTEVETDRVEVGALPASTLDRAIRGSRLALAEVLDASDIWDWHLDRRRGFYAWSWLLAHHLMLGPDPERDALRRGLNAFLTGEEPSLTEALDVSVNSLERRLQRYLERRPSTAVHEAVPVADRRYGYHCLDASASTRQLGLAIAQHNPALATRELEAQLEHDSDSAELWTVLSLAHEAANDRPATLAAARRAVSLAPDDPSAAVRLASALAMGCILELSAECRSRWREAVPLLRRALERDPTRQDAIFTLGLAYLYSGRPGDALNYLRIAYRRQPWAPHVNFYLGETYRLIGDVRAREHLLRARQWSPTEVWRKLADAGLELLASGG
ncbi:MAG TPA: hypothetical protein VF210_03070 [Pseudomonadales bacterium]